LLLQVSFLDISLDKTAVFSLDLRRRALLC
jgi:hypothetical protein